MAVTLTIQPPKQEIWLVRADGSQGHTLVNEEQVSYSNLSWSPDGLSLAYCRYSTSVIGDPEIWLADLAGGKQTRLLTGGILPALLP